MGVAMEDFILLVVASAVYMAALFIYNAMKPKKKKA